MVCRPLQGGERSVSAVRPGQGAHRGGNLLPEVAPVRLLHRGAGGRGGRGLLLWDRLGHPAAGRGAAGGMAAARRWCVHRTDLPHLSHGAGPGDKPGAGGRAGGGAYEVAHRPPDLPIHHHHAPCGGIRRQRGGSSPTGAPWPLLWAGR